MDQLYKRMGEVESRVEKMKRKVNTIESKLLYVSREKLAKDRFLAAHSFWICGWWNHKSKRLWDIGTRDQTINWFLDQLKGLEHRDTVDISSNVPKTRKGQPKLADKTKITMASMQDAQLAKKWFTTYALWAWDVTGDKYSQKL